MTFKKRSFTLLEIMAAMAIFAVVSFFLIERRNYSMERTHYALQLMKAQKIVDEVLMDYRLNPFEKDARPLPKDYTPFKVKVNVSEEKINILPEEWREVIDEFDLEAAEEEEDKERIILRIEVDVSWESLDQTKKEEEHYKITTLIRHIKLKEEDDSSVDRR